MKIILATPIYPPEIGGPATYTKELALRLRGDHEIVIVAYATTSERVEGTTLITASKRRPLPLRLLKYMILLFKAARDADVIYVQNAVASGFPAAVVGLLLRKPVVLKFVGDEAWERATQLRETRKQLEDFLAHPDGSLRIKLIMRLQGWVLRHVSAVTTPSAYLADAIIRTYRIDPKRVAVNYNAAEKTEEVPFDAIPVRHQIAVTARLVEWKGIDGVIRATVQLAEKFSDVRCVIAGDGPEEERLKMLAKEADDGSHIIFLGRVSRAETWHLRKSSEIYVLNSTYEGLPHTALTSFAAGIPIVATDIPGTNEAVYDGVSGLLVAPGDDSALARAIARLFDDAALREKLVAGGAKILSEKFSWKAHLRTLLEIFKQARATR
ncbi:glycosyltransferase family 4 protein [Candidatus Kaiserbacteria bacterium]|nr:glycosyltransferase family 4 protein [Candidatus Kaiserbacteria bacterium]